LKHLIESLERKKILARAEVAEMIDDVRHELDRIPALQGEQLANAKRTLDWLEVPPMRLKG
jgi:hypothetical protein